MGFGISKYLVDSPSKVQMGSSGGCPVQLSSNFKGGWPFKLHMANIP
jgi:hypothetical protein